MGDSNTTENDYLEMANHCKELLEQKDRLIAFYKSRLNEMDDELRSMAYLISNILYLVNFKNTENSALCKKNNEVTFFELLTQDLCKIKNFTDTLRDMTETDDDEATLDLLAVSFSMG